jgi:hypothetical protein
LLIKNKTVTPLYIAPKELAFLFLTLPQIKFDFAVPSYLLGGSTTLPSPSSTPNPANTTNELTGRTFSTINGDKSQIYTTGRVGGQGPVVTKLLNAGNIEPQILAHHTFREARTGTIFPGMTKAQIQAAGYGDTGDIKSHDFTFSGKALKAHVPFRVISADNSGYGSLVLEFIYPDGQKERAQFLHGDTPDEILQAANKEGKGNIFDGGTTFYLESGKGPSGASQYAKHTDMQAKTSVVADLVKANMQGQYLSFNGSNSSVVASNQNQTLVRAA